MKFLRFLLPVVLMSLSTAAFPQSGAQEPVDKASPSDAQESFTFLKTLAGTWQGPVTTVPPQHDMGFGTLAQVSLRVTSRGNALAHEMKQAGTPDDPARYDHPVTMLYLDRDRLLLTHYCDVGNRPRMVAKTSPDGNKVEFDFLDLSGDNQHGHMHHAVFTIIDPNHHIEDWTFMTPGDKPVQAHFDLKRAQ